LKDRDKNKNLLAIYFDGGKREGRKGDIFFSVHEMSCP